MIYELIADIDKALKGLLEPVYQEKITDEPKCAPYSGSRARQDRRLLVLEGEINRNALVRVQRNGAVVARAGSTR